jgi:hypothetical protein
MANRHRQTTVLSIFARLRWSANLTTRTTRCRDGHGRRSTLAVRPANGLVALEGPTLGMVYLSPLQVGHLRSALRGAVIDLDLLGGQYIADKVGPADENGLPMPRQHRRTVSLRSRNRPSVAEIVTRVAGDVSDAAAASDTRTFSRTGAVG